MIGSLITNAVNWWNVYDTIKSAFLPWLVLAEATNSYASEPFQLGERLTVRI